MNSSSKTATNWLSTIRYQCLNYFTNVKFKKLILGLLIVSISAVVVAANSDYEDDDIFESVKVNVANDWLIKLTKDAKLRDMFCLQRKLSIKGMQLIMQGNSEEGHPMIVEMQSLDKRILKDYKIDTLKL